MTKSGTISWILRRVRPRIPALLILTAAHMGTALLGVCFALGTRQVIDSAIGGSQPEFFRPASFRAGSFWVF